MNPKYKRTEKHFQLELGKSFRLAGYIYDHVVDMMGSQFSLGRGVDFIVSVPPKGQAIYIECKLVKIGFTKGGKLEAKGWNAFASGGIRPEQVAKLDHALKVGAKALIALNVASRNRFNRLVWIDWATVKAKRKWTGAELAELHNQGVQCHKGVFDVSFLERV